MRRKPLGAIVAWGSLGIFAVLTILGIAGLVMGLQPRPDATTEVETAALVAAPEPVVMPVEERLPEEVPFGEAPTQVEPVAAPVEVAAAPAAAAEAVASTDSVIASTFDQLVTSVVVPASEVPEGAVATVDLYDGITPAPAETAVAEAKVDLPMSAAEGKLAARPRVAVGRNAAAWAIESEVPDEGGANRTALGYAAQPEDDAVHVGDSSINVRSGPTQDNRKLFALAAGAEVNVVGKANGWVSITDERGREGWVDATLLENLDLNAVPAVKTVPAAEVVPAAEKPEKPSKVKKVAGSGVTVRAGPGKSNKQLFNLSGGTEVSVLDDDKGWLKIKDAKGRTGWAYKSYIR